jgi:hypothetical protein
MKVKRIVDKKIIGRFELVDLPEWELYGLQAKTDTGAYSCSIHCHEVRLSKADGVDILEFQLLDSDRPHYHDKIYRTKDFRIKKVTNSFGQSEERFLVKTKIMMFGELVETDFTLTDRGTMRFPILLGRKLLKKRFLVNVDRTNLSYKFLKKIKPK